MKDKDVNYKIYYESEREKHLNSIGTNIGTLNEAKKLLYKPPPDQKDETSKLMSPKARRDEIYKIKDNLDKYQ